MRSKTISRSRDSFCRNQKIFFTEKSNFVRFVGTCKTFRQSTKRSSSLVSRFQPDFHKNQVELFFLSVFFLTQWESAVFLSFPFSIRTVFHWQFSFLVQEYSETHRTLSRRGKTDLERENPVVVTAIRTNNGTTNPDNRGSTKYVETSDFIFQFSMLNQNADLIDKKNNRQT